MLKRHLRRLREYDNILGRNRLLNVIMIINYYLARASKLDFKFKNLQTKFRNHVFRSNFQFLFR